MSKSLKQLLESLGSTKEQVTASLIFADCGGVIGDRHKCPVAYYLEQRGIKDVAVDVDTVDYFDDGGFNIEPLPPAVIDFVQDFDDGLIPELKRVEIKKIAPAKMKSIKKIGEKPQCLRLHV